MVTVHQHDRQFIEAVSGFVRLCQVQITKVIEEFGEKRIRYASMEYLERIITLLYSIATSVDTRRSRLNGAHVEQLLEVSLVNEFQYMIIPLFSSFVFMFKNPHSLASRIQAVSRQEKMNDVDENARTQDITGPKGTKFTVQVQNKMMAIARFMVAFLRVSSQSGPALALNNFEQPILLYPSLLSSQEGGATIGSLFDLLRHIVSFLRKEFETCKNGRPSSHIINLAQFCESGMTFLSAQMKLYDTEDDLDSLSEIRQEYKSTFTEVQQLLKEVVKTWKQTEVIETTEFLIVMHSLMTNQ
jgi:hypothetical protein